MIDTLTRDAFEEAREMIRGRLHMTPILSASLLGQEAGTRLFLKCENLQKTGSFKVRGALHKLMRLPPVQKAAGVVTVSAGNHAQALAWAAREIGTPCTVVMPEGASPMKAEASRGYGARVILHGDVFAAFDKAHELEETNGLTFIHPFDDPEIVAGHGSMGLEILEQLPDVDLVVAGIGGGGHLSGIATAIKLVNPSVRLIGVEPTGAAAMHRSLEAGHPVRLEQISTIADGLAPPMVGNLNFEIVRQHVDDVVTVSDDDIVYAMARILTRAKLLAEPAGAAATAALLAGKIPVTRTERVVALVSGGNVGLGQLRAWGVLDRDP
jgi:threonine dehydratase